MKVMARAIPCTREDEQTLLPGRTLGRRREEKKEVGRGAAAGIRASFIAMRGQEGDKRVSDTIINMNS
jgi:hypothetical protein